MTNTLNIDELYMLMKFHNGEGDPKSYYGRLLIERGLVEMSTNGIESHVSPRGRAHLTQLTNTPLPTLVFVAQDGSIIVTKVAR